VLWPSIATVTPCRPGNNQSCDASMICWTPTHADNCIINDRSKYSKVVMYGRTA
jgi:hypothetical protein